MKLWTVYTKAHYSGYLQGVVEDVKDVNIVSRTKHPKPHNICKKGVVFDSFPVRHSWTHSSPCNLLHASKNRVHTLSPKAAKDIQYKIPHYNNVEEQGHSQIIRALIIFNVVFNTFFPPSCPIYFSGTSFSSYSKNKRASPDFEKVQGYITSTWLVNFEHTLLSISSSSSSLSMWHLNGSVSRNKHMFLTDYFRNWN